MERLLEGVTDDGWQYLDDDLIIACYHAPPQWIPLMKRIVVATEYVRAATQGDISTEDDNTSNEEDTKSKEDEDGSGSD